jgi:hypothetical protein
MVYLFDGDYRMIGNDSALYSGILQDTSVARIIANAASQAIGSSRQW